MKQQRIPSLVTVAILTTITLILWVVFSVYRVLTSEPSPEVPSDILAPLTPTLDSAAIDKIQKSVFFEEGQINTPLVSISPLPSPSLLPTPTATASPTASPSASPTVSPSPSATPTGG